MARMAFVLCVQTNTKRSDLDDVEKKCFPVHDHDLHDRGSLPGGSIQRTARREKSHSPEWRTESARAEWRSGEDPANLTKAQQLDDALEVKAFREERAQEE